MDPRLGDDADLDALLAGLPRARHPRAPRRRVQPRRPQPPAVREGARRRPGLGGRVLVRAAAGAGRAGRCSRATTARHARPRNPEVVRGTSAT